MACTPILGGAVLAALIATASAAHATDYQYVSDIDVLYWSYDGAAVSTDADINTLNLLENIGPEDATFVYTGPVNWVFDGPQNGPNLVSTFLNLSDIASFISPTGKFASVADFGNSTLSVAGDSLSSFFVLQGPFTFNQGYVTHDDGASVYIQNFSNLVVNSPGETAATTNYFTTSGGSHELIVTYVEGDGAPSVLQLAIANVPEPSTWAMMGLGFAALSFAGYFRRRRSRFSVEGAARI